MSECKVHIDPSLARGIRRAYLESLDENWAILLKRLRDRRTRIGVIHFKTPKAFHREIEYYRARMMPRFLLATDITIETKKRKAWILFSLTRERESLTEAGRAKVCCVYFGYPQFVDMQFLPIEFSGHAIDRMIQRAGILELPLKKKDLSLIHAGFSGVLIWAVSALEALSAMEPLERASLNIVVPSDLGIFLGNYDDAASKLIITTFVDSSRLWDEEVYALNQLNKVDEDQLALPILNFLVKDWIANTQNTARLELVKIWKMFGWQIRDRSRES